VCVDHHQADHLPGDLNIHDSAAPATGKIVLDIMRSMGVTPDRKMAQALFVAISTDTGWFRYSNTSATVLQDASQLMALGLDGAKMYREVYQRNEVSLIRLMGRVAATLNAEMGNSLLWATIPNALIEELRVGQFETDELLDLMRTGREAECVALFREMPDGEIRINLRSRGLVDTSEIAREFNGGGHRHASGATIEGPLDDVARRVVKRLKEALAVGSAAG